MKLLRSAFQLAAKDFQLEFRSQFALASVILFVGSSIFMAYIAFQRIVDTNTWNALFWVILLFGLIAATNGSFSEWRNGQKFYLFTLSNAQAQFIGKFIINSAFISIISVIHLIIFSIFLGNQVENIGLWLTGILLGTIAMSAILTLVAAIAAAGQNNFTLMSILGLPVLLPVILVSIRVCRNAIAGLDWGINVQYLGMQAAFIMLTLALGYLLIPYLWRE